MKLSQAESLAIELSSMLNAKGIVGYKIARNLRMINDELKEYHQIKADLFRKYGREADGQLVIDKGSDGYPLYLQEIAPIESEEISFNFRAFTDEELEQSDLTGRQMMFLMENFMGDES